MLLPRFLLPVSAALTALFLAAGLGARAPGESGRAATGNEGAAAQNGGRVIVLGIDGMDARLAQQWIDAGQLPNFAKLRDGGTFAPLQPGNPAQSPVSWATLNTGKNPGKHNIFDFVRNRRPDSMPDIGFQEEKLIPAAEVRNPQWGGGNGLWFLGAGVVLAAVLALGLRRQPLFAAVAALAALGGGAFAYTRAKVVLPEKGFEDWESLCRAEEYWYDLDRAGVAFRGHGVIVDYPAGELANGQMICGLGAPDAKGRLNNWAVYTTLAERRRQRKNYKSEPAYAEADAPTPDVRSGVSAGSGKIYRLVETSPGSWESKFYGPENLVRKEQLEAQRDRLEPGDPELDRVRKLLGNVDLMSTYVPLRAEWRPGDAAAVLTIGGHRQTVQLGSWSDFYKLEFPWAAGLSTHGMVRAWVEADGTGLEIFTAALQIDPRRPTPASRICWPPDFAGQVAERIGDYETLGWACETHALKDAELSEAAFVSDIEFTETWRMNMLRDALADDSWRVLFHFFGSPDRVCHMWMHHFDQKHPQYDAAGAERVYPFFGKQVAAKDLVLAIYQQMDVYLGELLGKLRPEDTLLVVSDHGFDSFRRQVNLNTWLAREGFLKLKDTVTTGASEALPSRYADWSATQAYSIGIGKIFLARQGREKYGIVKDAEAEEVLKAIEAKLWELTDPATGEKIVRQIYRREQIYSGSYWGGKEGAPELTIDFAPGYRASWSCTGGGIDLAKDDAGNVVLEEAVYDNDKPWSGDHCGVDMAVVKGIFFSNRKFTLPAGDTEFDAAHLAPTVLDLTGVKIPADYDRKPLLR